MQKRHTDRESYFGEQSQTSKNYYIPYIKEVIGHIPDKVLEVGCGEGGNLLPFAKAGCRVMGVDIDAMRIEQARTFFTQRHQQGQFIATDIFQLEDKATNFPLILLHDVIEHIRDKERFLSGLQKHLSSRRSCICRISRLANAIRRPPADSTQPHCFTFSLFSTSFPALYTDGY